MGIAENKDLVQSLFDLVNAGNVPAFMDHLADDVRWTNIGTTAHSGTFEGKDNVATELLGPVFEKLDGGLSATVHRLIAEGDYVVVESSGEAVTKTGRAYNNTYCHVFRIVDGKIQEVTEYMDTALLGSALGG